MRKPRPALRPRKPAASPMPDQSGTTTNNPILTGKQRDFIEALVQINFSAPWVSGRVGPFLPLIQIKWWHVTVPETCNTNVRLLPSTNTTLGGGLERQRLDAREALVVELDLGLKHLVISLVVMASSSCSLSAAMVFCSSQLARLIYNIDRKSLISRRYLIIVFQAYQRFRRSTLSPSLVRSHTSLFVAVRALQPNIEWHPHM